MRKPSREPSTHCRITQSGFAIKREFTSHHPPSTPPNHRRERQSNLKKSPEKWRKKRQERGGSWSSLAICRDARAQSESSFRIRRGDFCHFFLQTHISVCKYFRFCVFRGRRRRRGPRVQLQLCI